MIKFIFKDTRLNFWNDAPFFVVRDLRMLFPDLFSGFPSVFSLKLYLFPESCFSDLEEKLLRITHVS